MGTWKIRDFNWNVMKPKLVTSKNIALIILEILENCNTLSSDWIIYKTLMSKNSFVAITFILQLHFSRKTEIKYKNR